MNGNVSADTVSPCGPAWPTETVSGLNITAVSTCTALSVAVAFSISRKDEDESTQALAQLRLRAHLSTEEFCDKEDWLRQEITFHQKFGPIRKQKR